jgi:hypothetical protein
MQLLGHLRWVRLLHRPPPDVAPVRIDHPADLTTRRFDVHIKYLYAKALEDGEDLELFRSIYREHLRVWNGFREIHPSKHSFEDFDKSFKAILKSIRKFGFSPRISLVPVSEAGWYPVNGAHRIAAAMLYDQPVYCRVGVYPCVYYDETFFRLLGLNEAYLAIVRDRRSAIGHGA